MERRRAIQCKVEGAGKLGNIGRGPQLVKKANAADPSLMKGGFCCLGKKNGFKL
jgi:hypothetical protein